MTGLRSAADLDLQSNNLRNAGNVFITGLQAGVRRLLDQVQVVHPVGLRTAVFANGYPASPLDGFDRELAAQRALFEHEDVNLSNVEEYRSELAARLGSR